MARANVGVVVAPLVLVVLDLSGAWSRGVLAGFTRVAHERGWGLLHYHPGVDLTWLASRFRPGASVLGPTGCPWPDALRSPVCVSLNVDRTAQGIPSVCVDDAAVGALSFQHLWARGYRTVSTFRFDDSEFAIARERAFLAAAEQSGATLASRWWQDGAKPPRSIEDPEAISSWLCSLPRPTAIFAGCDPWGRVVARYARVLGLRVPEDIALLGVDNDTAECELLSPALSSVAVPWSSLGEAAADLVLRGLSGCRLAPKRIDVAPVGVVSRPSSDRAAVADPTVAAAMTWIEAHATRRVLVPMVAEAVGVPRRRLERRFRLALGRSVLEEIRRAHVEVAKRLLETTGLTLPEIAQRSGFTNAGLLADAFRRETELTPGQYRRKLSSAQAS